jgi:hypothetical protein
VASGQILRKLFLFFFLKLPDSKLQQVAKNIEDSRFFFLLSYFFNFQIWLNHLMDDHHVGYITPKKKKKTMLGNKTKDFVRKKCAKVTRFRGIFFKKFHETAIFRQ